MELGFLGVTCAILVPGILWASWIDYSERRVPNWLNASLIIMGFAVQGLYHGWAGLSAGAFGLAVGFGVLIVPWLMHGMGAGDVKLMAAIGVWFGPWMTAQAFALGAVIGGVAAMVMILSTRRLRYACANLNIILTKCTHPKLLFDEFGSARSFGDTSQLLPYGVPLTAGSLIVLGAKMFGWWSV